VEIARIPEERLDFDPQEESIADIAAYSGERGA
jgi:hypothetical protein